MSAPLLYSKHHRKWVERDRADEQDVDPARLAYGKDYDRILYSTAFRRLGGITQVVTSGEVALFHNRLTHTLKTAQVGARIANYLARKYTGPQWQTEIDNYGGLDARVVRAACMAHDLGHPPFGHIAEDELQRICSGSPDEIRPKWKAGNQPIQASRSPRLEPSGYELPDGFEGNAQSFRIVTKLAFRELGERTDIRPALNLSKGTLFATLKYPWPHNSQPDMTKKKWGFYDSELEIAKWVFGGVDKPEKREVNVRGRLTEQRCIEAQVMDWADDISYAVHDVEDFFRAGVIPLDFLYTSNNEWEQFFKYAWTNKVEGLFPGMEDQVRKWLHPIRITFFPKKQFEGSGTDREALHHFASNIITNATEGTEIKHGGVVVPSDEQLAIIETLKQLTWYYVIDSPSLESTQRGQRYVIRSLFRHIIEWVVEDWEGPRDPTSTSNRASRRKLPARLIDNLETAFSPDPFTGCNSYGNDDRKRVSRAVIDYIVSLTEMQAMGLHAKLTGESGGSMLDSWVTI